MRVHADGEDLNIIAELISEQRLQLPELIVAVGSPMTAIEDQRH
jgi:hypothetical protein